MAKKATPANTGLSIARNGNKFTATWKLQAKSPSAQKLKYSYHNGKQWSKGVTVNLAAKATSYSWEYNPAAPVKQIKVETTISQSGYSASTASYTYKVTPPPAPTVSVSNDSANKTTFSWSISTSDTNTAWFYRCMFRTKISDTPDSDTGWTDWAHLANQSWTVTDTDIAKTRIFQLKAVGPAGESKVVTQRHVLGPAPAATWSDTPVTYSTMGSYYQMTYNFNLKGSTYSVDGITPQFYIGAPEIDMSCPTDASWTDGGTYNYANNWTNYSLAIATTDFVGENECMWARVKTEHDSAVTTSDTYRVITGALSIPSCSITMGTITATGFRVTVNVLNANTDIDGVYQQVFLEKESAAGIANYILIGTVPNGSSSATITSSINLTGESGYAIHVRNVTADGKSMKSDYFDYTSSMPLAPTLTSVEATSTSGKVYLSWTNNWADATGVIIAWTDDPDNWMSNDEPETYELSEIASHWFITGVETGKKWYFRVRSVCVTEESTTYSPWSKDVSIDLSSAPAVPVLYLSEETITENGMVTAYWSYVSTDGTLQVAGNVVEATYSNGAWHYGRTVGATTSAQHVDIYAKAQGWQNGDVVYLALQTRAGSGGASGYSTPVKLEIAAEPTVTITSTNLASSETLTEYFEGDGSTKVFTCSSTLSSAPTVTVNGSSRSSSYSGDKVTLTSAPAAGATVVIRYTTSANRVLTTLPMTATITSTNASALTVAIERAEAYPIIRPDGTKMDGAVGETVYVSTISANASNSISIELNDLIGRLDDGAYYNFVATASDKYGQTAVQSIRFRVHWSHQAGVPTATFVTDEPNYAVRITPTAPSGAANGDTCDIYRLGADMPELIVSGGNFGTTYVDPYPAFGEYSGYKIVTVTANGDYITESNEFAQYDTTLSTGAYTQLDPGLLVIDFDGNRAELPYNIGLGNSWAKDFKRTAYLGGHVAGDHNKAVTRDLSASTVVVRGDNGGIDTIMRDLARYAGICHVRTPEGSSFAADIQVSEDISYDSALISYSLSIQKVDTVGFDGMTYAEWSEMQ